MGSVKDSKLDRLITEKNNTQIKLKTWMKNNEVKLRSVGIYLYLNQYIDNSNSIEIEAKKIIENLQSKQQRINTAIERQKYENIKMNNLIKKLEDLEHSINYYKTILKKQDAGSR